MRYVFGEKPLAETMDSDRLPVALQADLVLNGF
jgi:hypothetical protein